MVFLIEWGAKEWTDCHLQEQSCMEIRMMFHQVYIPIRMGGPCSPEWIFYDCQWIKKNSCFADISR
jgi:hypothetical protein